MAITAPTKTSDFSGFIPANIAQPIFERAARISVVQRLVQQVPLSFRGESVPVVTGRIQAGWVNEAGQKPASAGSMTLKSIEPKKLSAIAVVSAEVVRANPGNYVTLVRSQIAEAFAQAFDLAALYDRGPDGTPGGGPFATNIGATTKSVELGSTSKANGGVYGDLVKALQLLVADANSAGRRYQLTGFALDSVAEPLLLGATDANGRPLFVDVPLDQTTTAMFTDPSVAQPARPGRLLGRPAWLSEGVTDELTDIGQGIVGIAGDWRECAWGVVGGISYDVSTEATVTINGALTSLWEHNLVAIRAEAEYGWICNDTDAFVKLTNDIAVSSS